MADPTLQAQEPSQQGGASAESLSVRSGESAPSFNDFLTYSQGTGHINHHVNGGEALIGGGWAGHGAGKNNTRYEAEPCIGPLPRGWYEIGEPFTHPKVGPYALRLTPDPDTEMYGRDGFLIHGAAMDPAKRGEESKGCIVAGRTIRETIHALGVTRLLVIA